MIRFSNGVLLTLLAVFMVSNTAIAANYEKVAGGYINYTSEDIGNDVTVDAAGNVYLLGKTSNNLSVIYKYSPTGAYLWSRQYNSIGTGVTLNAIAGSGSSLYVTGKASRPTGNYDCITAALDANGNLSWYKYFGGTKNESCNDIVVDHNGDVIVGGSLGLSGSFSLVVKYDANGNHINDTYFVIGVDEQITKLSVDGNNNIYGLVVAAAGQRRIARLNANLQRIDFSSPLEFHDAAEKTTPMSVAADLSGNVYAAGMNSPGGGVYLLTVIKYDSNGQEVCRGELDGNSHNAYSYYDVKVNANGDIYLTGGGDFVTSNTITVQYDTNCQLSSNILSENGGYHDISRAIAVDNNSNIYVIGDSVRTVNLPFYSPKDRDIAVVKYSVIQ